jgi:Coenzyme Q (ubiquinone) biosynthesis protein Coq4
MHFFAYSMRLCTKLHMHKVDKLPMEVAMTGLTKAQRTHQWPLTGINWREVALAYRTFLGSASTGIHHILRAQRRSVWQQWVNRRLARQAAHLTGRTIAIDLAQLAQLPPDSLGGTYARHMIGLGLDPKAFVTAEDDWLDQRAAIGHDIFHVIAGYDASPVGEFGVAAFTLVQYGDLLNVFVLSFVPISLTNPLWTWPLLRALVRGFRMGRSSKPVVAYPVEDNWAKPLWIVRQELGIANYFAH